jgi:hypothetical protein
MAAISGDQIKMMAAVISETLQQIHEARIVPGAPTFMAEDSEMKDLMKVLAKQMQGKGGGGGHRAVLDERSFRRLEKFTNKESDWEAWQANVEVAISAVHWPTAKLMEDVAKKEVADDKRLKELFEELAMEKGWDAEEFDKEMMKVNGELYQHLCLWTAGEANTIVRAVRERVGSWPGSDCWRGSRQGRLHEDFRR